MEAIRVLLCEDDSNTRWALAKVLRQNGAMVHEAADAQEGLNFLAKDQYDVLISDVCMPGLGGFGVFAALRFGEGEAYAEHSNMPIVLMSGQVNGGEVARALDAGVDEFLAKPIDPHEFSARIRNVIRRARRESGPTARTAGDLVDFGMDALVQALHLSGRSARLRAVSGDRTGTLHFQRGDISHAVLEGPALEKRGDKAALEILGFREGTFECLPLPDSAPRTVFISTERLVLLSAQQHDEITSEI